MKLLFLGPPSVLMKMWCSFFANKHEVLYATIPDRISLKGRARLFEETPVRYLVKEGIYDPNGFMGRIRIATRIADGTKNLICAHALQPSYVGTIPSSASSPFRFLFQFAYLDRVRRLVSEENPDLVEGHYLFPHGVLAAFSRHRRVGLSLWGSDVLRDCPRNSYFRILAKKAFDKATFVHGECSSMKTVALRLGCPEEKFFVIPWGIDLDVFSPQSKNAQIRDRYGIKNDAPLIISDRALDPIYRIDEVVRGFALVKKKLPEARLIILNDGPERAKLVNLCIDLAIYDSVYFTGMISHEKLPFFLNSSDVYVQMPKSDALPLSLLEAMGCGLPVITSGVGGNPEAIHGNGFIVNNHVELAERILLMFQRNIVKDLGKKGRDIVEREYDGKTTVDKMEELYRRFSKGA